MDGNDRIFTYKVRTVTTDELDRLLSTQDIDPFAPLQITKQSEILAQNPVCRRIPAGIDDEDLKPGTRGRRSCRLLSVGWRLDDEGFFSPDGLLQSGRRSRNLPAPGVEGRGPCPGRP